MQDPPGGRNPSYLLPHAACAVGELNQDFVVEELSGKTLEAFKMFI